MRITTQQLAGNKLIHVDVGLMQPPAPDVLYGHTRSLYLLLQMLCSHRTNVFENLTAVLVKQSVLSKSIAALGARNIAKIRTNVV